MEECRKVTEGVKRIKIQEPFLFNYNGLLQTINGIIMVWDDLKDSLTYLFTSHLNQDPFENQFPIVRNNRGSYEKNPTALRFVKNISLCIFQNI